MAAVAVRKKVVSIGHFSPSFCLQSFFHLLYQIKSYCINWLHWKLEKNRTEQNKLDKLEYLKSFIKTTRYAQWPAFLYLHTQTRVQISIHLFHLKSEKNWAKWAKWARLLKNIHTDEQPCSWICFLVFSCSNKHRYTPLLILLKIIKIFKKFNLSFLYINL